MRTYYAKCLPDQFGIIICFTFFNFVCPQSHNSFACTSPFLACCSFFWLSFLLLFFLFYCSCFSVFSFCLSLPFFSFLFFFCPSFLLFLFCFFSVFFSLLSHPFLFFFFFLLFFFIFYSFLSLFSSLSIFFCFSLSLVFCVFSD